MLSVRARTANATRLVRSTSFRASDLISGRPEDVERHLQGEPLEKDDSKSWDRMLQAHRVRKVTFDRMSQLGSTQTRENSWQPHHSLHKPTKPSELTLSALVAAGAHYGHSKSLLNSAYTGFAYGTRAGVVIIDMDQTLPYLRRAANVVRSVAANGGSIIIVGTKPELSRAVRKAVARIGHNAFHLADGWTPGIFTNKHAIFGYPTANNLRIVPDLVIFLNPLQNMQAIRECALEHVPTIGIIDSNVDPRIVLYPIPANDDSVRTGELIAGLLSIAGREGIELWREELRTQAKKREERRAAEQRRAAEEEEQQRLAKENTKRMRMERNAEYERNGAERAAATGSYEYQNWRKFVAERQGADSQTSGNDAMAVLDDAGSSGDQLEAVQRVADQEDGAEARGAAKQ